MGKAMFTFAAAMAELERSLIREHVIAGLNFPRANGTKSGHAVGRPRKVFRRHTVLEMRGAGKSWQKIAGAVWAEVTTIRRVAGHGAEDVAPKFGGGACDYDRSQTTVEWLGALSRRGVRNREGGCFWRRWSSGSGTGPSHTPETPYSISARTLPGETSWAETKGRGTSGVSGLK